MIDSEVWLKIFDDPDKDIGDRLRAARNLYWNSGIEVIPHLLRDFDERPLELRLGLESLLEDSHRDLVDTLSAEFNPEKIVALIHNIDPSYTKRENFLSSDIQKALNSRNSIVRKLGLRLLQIIPGEIRWKKAHIESFLNDVNFDVRREALIILAELGDISYIEAGLSDPHKDVITTALELARKYAYRISYGWITKLRNHPDESLQTRLIDYEVSFAPEIIDEMEAFRILNFVFANKVSTRSLSRIFSHFIYNNYTRFIDLIPDILAMDLGNTDILKALIGVLTEYRMKGYIPIVMDNFFNYPNAVREDAAGYLLSLMDSGEKYIDGTAFRRFIERAVDDNKYSIRKNIYLLILRLRYFNIVPKLLERLRRTPLNDEKTMIFEILMTFPLANVLIPIIEYYRATPETMLYPAIRDLIHVCFRNPMALRHLKNLTVPYLLGLLERKEFGEIAQKILILWGFKTLKVIEHQMGAYRPDPAGPISDDPIIDVRKKENARENERIGFIMDFLYRKNRIRRNERKLSVLFTGYVISEKAPPAVHGDDEADKNKNNAPEDDSDFEIIL